MKPSSPAHKKLKQRLKVATEAQKQAVKRFKDVVRDIPSGLHPDGSRRILKASRELTEAHGEVVSLLMELNRSSLDGDGEKRR